MHKHNIGDIVRIRKDLIEGLWYGNDTLIDAMLIFKGTKAKIIQLQEPDKYRIDLDCGRHNWTNEMFEDSGSEIFTDTNIVNFGFKAMEI